MVEPLDKPLSKSLQRGEDPQFDQLLSAFGTVAEHCLPSLLKTLFAWYERQGVEWIISDFKGKGDSKGKSELSGARSELEFVSERRDLAVEFIFWEQKTTIIVDVTCFLFLASMSNLKQHTI